MHVRIRALVITDLVLESVVIRAIFNNYLALCHAREDENPDSLRFALDLLYIIEYSASIKV